MANTSAIAFGPQLAGIGNKHVYCVNVAIDTYATNGVAVSVPASITKPVVFAQTTGGYVAEWDATNSKVKLYSAGTEVSAGAVSVTVTLLFIGQ